jgi:pSer/pThr/pTyr-binding forkhead associated (FHA) protein
MAKLILSLDGQIIKEVALNKERTTIGRKPHNDIQIDNLAVSGEHAIVMTILNDSFLEDLGSTNGTLVNGQAVKKHFLQNSDVVEIGKYKLKYVNEVNANMSQADFEKTMVLRAPASAPKKPEVKSADPQITQTNMTPPPPAGMAETSSGAVMAKAAEAALSTTSPNIAPAAAAPIHGGGTIQILSGPNAGKELPLTKPLTTLGKPGVQVAVIAKRPQGYFITHVEGANFPVVNGRALDAQARALNDHDVIELAGVKMEFFVKP